MLPLDIQKDLRTKLLVLDNLELLHDILNQSFLSFEAQIKTDNTDISGRAFQRSTECRSRTIFL